MTVEALANQLGFKTLCMPSPEKEIQGVYIGDLLSWVMGKADQGNVWITIMSNVNTLAVATLVDASCILLAEEVIPDAEILETAKAKGINILSTPLSAYRAAIMLAESLS
ncbi:MAG: hypothetical protein J6V80_02975 [Clostridia bacterium]|nr:hypothetical protein [Clostridia bacterium]